MNQLWRTKIKKKNTWKEHILYPIGKIWLFDLIARWIVLNNTCSMAKRWFESEPVGDCELQKWLTNDVVWVWEWVKGRQVTFWGFENERKKMKYYGFVKF